MPDSFPFRTEPFQHQADEFFGHRDDAYRALWWAPGCAKTKPIIDTSAHLFREGEIVGVLVLAPETVHAQWCRDQYPEHLPDFARSGARRFVWETKRAKAKYFQEKFDDFVRHDGGLRVLAMTYSSLMTKHGVEAAKRFIASGPTMLVLDESHFIKGPDTARTKRVLNLAWHYRTKQPRVPYRRVLTGTPVSNAPFDAYTQCRFLDWTVWHQLDIGGSVDFRAYFGVYRRRWNGKQGRFWENLEGYRRLDELREVALRMGSRFTKDQVLAHLPDKLYEKAYFDMIPSQRKLYDELERDYRAWFDDGSKVTAEMAMVRRMRLQQIACGYVPTDDPDREEPVRMLMPAEENPRLRALAETLEALPGQCVVWAKYDLDVDGIVAWAKKVGKTAVTYDGRVSTEDRLENRDRFVRGEVDLFVGKTRAGGTGLDGLQKAASEAIFYSNTDRLDDRLQAEDRIHRPGMDDRPATYFDIIASGSVDASIVKNLRDKFDVAACVMGDEIRNWI